MRYLVTATLLAFFGFAQSAHAGIYLQQFHNNSSAEVVISAKVPFGWVDVPAYPYKVRPHHSLYDERYYDQAYWKLARHKVRNVAIPPGGSCSRDTYLRIVVGNTHDYIVYDCNWQLHIEKKTGGRYQPFMSPRQKEGKPAVKADPVNYWAGFIEPNGDLVITNYRKDLSSGDGYREQDR